MHADAIVRESLSLLYLCRVCLQRRALPYVDALTPSSQDKLDKEEAAANAAKAPVSEILDPLTATAASGVFLCYAAERDLRGEASTLSAAAAAERVQGAFRGRRARKCARQVYTHRERDRHTHTHEFPRTRMCSIKSLHADF